MNPMLVIEMALKINLIYFVGANELVFMLLLCFLKCFIA